MFLVHNKNERIDLPVPILLEGTVVYPTGNTLAFNTQLGFQFIKLWFMYALCIILAFLVNKDNFDQKRKIKSDNIIWKKYIMNDEIETVTGSALRFVDLSNH